MVYISPREFYQTYQPHGDKATIYVQDTLEGDRMVSVERVSLDGNRYFVHVEGRRVPARSGMELIVKNVRTPAPALQPLFDWYVNDEFQRDLIGYNDTLRDYFEDSYELQKISVATTLGRLIQACGSVKSEDAVGMRASLVSKLADVMLLIDSADYAEASQILASINPKVASLVDAVNGLPL